MSKWYSKRYHARNFRQYHPTDSCSHVSAKSESTVGQGSLQNKTATNIEPIIESALSNHTSSDHMLDDGGWCSTATLDIPINDGDIDDTQKALDQEPGPDWTLVEQRIPNSVEDEIEPRGDNMIDTDRQVLAEERVRLLRKELARQDDKVKLLERDIQVFQAQCEQSQAKYGALEHKLSLRAAEDAASQSQKHEANIFALNYRHEAELKRLAEEHRDRLDDEAKSKYDVVASKEKQLKKALAELAASNEKLGKAESSIARKDARIEELLADQSSLKSQIQKQTKALDVEHAAEIDGLRERLQQRISAKSIQAEEYLRSAKGIQVELETAVNDRRNEMAALKRKHASEIEVLRRQHAADIHARTSQWQHDAEICEAENDTAINKLRTQLSEVQQRSFSASASQIFVPATGGKRSSGNRFTGQDVNSGKYTFGAHTSGHLGRGECQHDCLYCNRG